MVARSHGLRGDVLVKLTSDLEARMAPGVSYDTERGPLCIERSQPYQDRWLVHFAGVETREAADALRGVILRAEPIDVPDVLWVHHLVGKPVVLGDGTVVGECVAVVDNPASDLLELDTGALVPVVFVVEAGERITIDPPEGLLEL